MSVNGIQGHQIVIEGTQPNLALPTRSALNSFAAGIESLAGAPVRLSASFPTPNAFLNFGVQEVLDPDGAGRSVPPINANIPTIPASTINFQTNATTGATFVFTSPSGPGVPSNTVNQYVRVGFTLLSTGNIQGIFSSPQSTLGAVANPGTLFISSGVPLGWVDLQCTGTTFYKTSGSSSNIIENAPGGLQAIHRFGSGGSGGGGGTGGAPVEPDELYQTLAYDQMTSAPGVGSSMIDSTISNGTYDVVNHLIKISCDKTKTCTTTGTSYTLSSNPGYLVAAGDIIYDNVSGTFRRIATVSTQSTGTLASAFATNLASNSVMVSQAAWTLELTHVGDASEHIRPIDINGVANQTQILVQYQDSTASGDSIFDMSFEAEVVIAASNSGLSTDVGQPLEDTYSLYQARPVGDAEFYDLELPINTNQERLFVVFFPNPVNGAVTTTVNLLALYVNFYLNTNLTPVNNGGILDSAFCMTDSSGTPSNCSNPTVVGGFTQIVLDFGFVYGLAPGQSTGDLDVYLEGEYIPKFYPGVIGAYWTPVNINTMAFYADLSGFSYSVQIIRRQAVADYSVRNTLRLTGVADLVVGSAEQVASGMADYTSIQAAHDDLTVLGYPAKILLLVGTVTESVTWTNSNLTLEGKGRGSILNGNLTFNSGAVGNLHRALKVNGNVTYNAGADGNFFTDAWVGAGFVLTNSGSGNVPNYIQET